jgi:hypothetical protein
MDSVKGAIQLKKIIDEVAAEGGGVDPEPPHVPADALPVFHWLGVVPGGAAEDVVSPGD